MATYKIKQGDNLSTIAKKYGTTVSALAKTNNISNPNKIYTGSSLTIPGATTTKKATTPKTTIKKATTTTTPNVPTLAKVETTKPTYTQSSAVTNAANMLSQYEANKPGAYQSSYADQINSLLGQIQNREKFNYDMNADPMYQQYKDQYTNAGQLSMMDTMGNAASLTGGYGSSYASTAGNQAYQANLQQLNNVIPELYSAAYNKYQGEGNEMYNQANLLQSQDQMEYGKYQDATANYYNDLNYAYNKSNDMSEQDYNKYLNNQAAWEADRSYYYGKEQDSLTQQNYLSELARQKALDAQSQSNWQKEYNLNAANVNSTIANRNSSGSGGSKSSGSTNKTSSLKGSTSSTTKKSTASNKESYSTYSAKVKSLAKSSSTSADNYVRSLYNAGLITEDEAVKLGMIAGTTSTLTPNKSSIGNLLMK